MNTKEFQQRLTVFYTELFIYVRLLICGEAYSNQQGWVEGALETAEIMLQDYFSLDKPDWLCSC